MMDGFYLSVFGDEIATSIDEQLECLLDQRIALVDMQYVEGKLVDELTDAEALYIREMCDAAGVSVHALASKVNWSLLTAPIEEAVQQLARLMALAEILGTQRIRIFGGCQPLGRKGADFLGPAIQRLKALTPIAEAASILLLLENEVGTVADIPSNIHSLLHAVNSPSLRMAWNPGNFVRAGVAEQVTDYWLLLQRFVEWVILKDARLSDQQVCTPGEGDAQLWVLLKNLQLRGRGYTLSLQPHMSAGSANIGFSGQAGIEWSTVLLRERLAALGVLV